MSNPAPSRAALAQLRAWIDGEIRSNRERCDNASGEDQPYAAGAADALSDVLNLLDALLPAEGSPLADQPMTPAMARWTKLLGDVTRLEVIDETGRAYSRWNIKLEHLGHSIQDTGRTLKLFVAEREPSGDEPGRTTDRPEEA